MTDVLVEKQSLIDTADAIRAKLGTQALIAPEDFDTEIAKISGGGGDYGTVTVCSYTYTGSVYDYSNCSVTITDADVFFETALEKGWLYVSTDSDDIIAQVDFQYSSSGLWYVQDNYYTRYSAAELNQFGITVALDSGVTWASFAIRFVFTFNTSDTTQLHFTEKMDFMSLGYLSTKYSEYGMGHDNMPSTFTLDDGTYLKAQIISYASGTDVAETSDCFLANCDNLTSVSITGATKIGSYFLYNCSNFDSPITIPSTVTEVGSNFMSGCTSFDQAITFPASVTSIGENCLYGCTSLNSQVTVSAQVLSLSSFMNACSAYNQPITIPSTVTTLEQFMTGCSSFNQPITIPNGVTEITSLLSDCSAFNQPITVPASVTKISNFIFNMGSFNSTVTFSEGLETIGYYCFYNCATFNKPISLPSTVETINFNFLAACPAFNSTIDLGSVSSIENGFLQASTSFNQNITLPSTLTYVNVNQFMYNCNAMTSTVTVNTSFTPSANSSAMATVSSSAACYTTGIKVGGTNGAAWRSAFANRTSSPYRKLLAA